MLMFMIFTAMFTVSTYLATYTIYINHISMKNVLPIQCIHIFALTFLNYGIGLFRAHLFQLTPGLE